MPSASRSSVAQFSVSASQLIKLIKSVSSLVLKKVTTVVCVFLRKAPTKKWVDFRTSQCTLIRRRNQELKIFVHFCDSRRVLTKR